MSTPTTMMRTRVQEVALLKVPKLASPTMGKGGGAPSVLLRQPRVSRMAPPVPKLASQTMGKGGGVLLVLEIVVVT